MTRTATLTSFRLHLDFKEVQGDTFLLCLGVTGQRPVASGSCGHRPEHGQVYLAVRLELEEALAQDCPLHHHRAQQQCEAHSAVAVLPQEHHEEAEADEDHHMHVLEH